MKIRTFSIINGTNADLVIGAVDLTGDVRFTLDAIVLPLTILAHDEYVVTANFDDTSVSGVHSAEVTVTTQDLAYTNKTKLSSAEDVIPAPVMLGQVTSSSLLTGSDTEQILATGATTYAVTGLPVWASVDTNTGLVTVTPDGTLYGEERYTTQAINAAGTRELVEGLKVQVFRDQAAIAGKMGETPATPVDTTNSLNSISGYGYVPLVYDAPNNFWKGLVSYYTSYGANNQLKILNLTTKLEDRNYPLYLEGTPLNTASTVVAHSLDTYIRFYSVLVKYNTTTGNLETMANVPVNLGGSILYPSLELGMDGKLVLGGTNATNQVVIAEYDVALGTYTESAGMNQDADPAANRDAAADALYFYCSTNGNGSGYRVYAMDRATSTGVKLANCITWVTVVQGKYGCWVHMPAGSTEIDGVTPIAEGKYYLHLGGLVFAPNGLEQATCPWDNMGEPFVSNTGSPIDPFYIYDHAGLLPPSGSNSGSYWFKRQQSDAWTGVPIDNITTYPIALTDIIASTAGNQILSVGDRYAGYAVLDLATSEVSNYNIASSLSNYCNLEVNGKIYMSGYPSGTLVEYDPSLPWDNTSSVYNPDTSPVGTNPKFIGYTRFDSPDIGGVSIGGTGGGQHKNFALIYDNAGKLWCFGEYERDGFGLGGTSVDLNDSYRMVGYRDAVTQSAHNPKAGCNTENYLVCLCAGLSDLTDLDLMRMDKATNTQTNIALPITANLIGDIVSYGVDKVLVCSASATNDLMLIAIDVVTGLEIYTKTFTGITTYSCEFIELSDGNLYIRAHTYLALVEPINGWIEPVTDLTIAGQSAQGNDGKLYTVSDTLTYSVASPEIPKTFSVVPLGVEIIGLPTETAAHITMVDNLDGTYTFTDDGTFTGYWSLKTTLTQLPINPVDWLFTFDLVSGHVKVQTITVASWNGNTIATVLSLPSTTFSGAELVPSETNSTLQMYSNSTAGVFTLTAFSAKERQ